MAGYAYNYGTVKPFGSVSVVYGLQNPNIRGDRWWNEAACIEVGEAIFFETDPEAIEQAKAVCATCPVTEECLRDGVLDEFGIRGGMTPDERRKYNRRVFGVRRKYVS